MNRTSVRRWSNKFVRSIHSKCLADVHIKLGKFDKTLSGITYTISYETTLPSYWIGVVLSDEDAMCLTGFDAQNRRKRPSPELTDDDGYVWYLGGWALSDNLKKAGERSLRGQAYVLFSMSRTRFTDKKYRSGKVSVNFIEAL